MAEVCLKGLIALLSNRSNEAIVAQAVIVIRTQIMNREREVRMVQNGFLDSTESNSSVGSNTSIDSSEVTSLIIKQLVSSKLMDSDPTEAGIKDKTGKTAWSKARATIVWILAEFCCKNLKAYTMAPDVLRKFAKSFHQESDLVKLQVLSLAAKMSVVMQDKYILPFLLQDQDKSSLFDRQRFNLLVTYIFNLAKYDLNYDIRDRARFLKFLMTTASGVDSLTNQPPLDSGDQTSDATNSVPSVSDADFESVRSILFKKQEGIAMNGIPAEERRGYRRKKYIGYSRFRVGTLSHFLNQEVSGYEELPSFPDVPSDPSLRAPPPEPVSPVSPPGSTSGRSVSGKPSVVKSVKIREKKEKFYSDDESEEEEDSDEEETEDEDSDEDEESSSGEEEGEEEEEEGSTDDEDEEDEDSSEGSDESESSDDDEEDEEEQPQLSSPSKKKSQQLLLHFS